nr:MAG TPA: hypothetical protein [Inoviridae sp.]
MVLCLCFRCYSSRKHFSSAGSPVCSQKTKYYFKPFIRGRTYLFFLKCPHDTDYIYLAFADAACYNHNRCHSLNRQRKGVYHMNFLYSLFNSLIANIIYDYIRRKINNSDKNDSNN